MFRGAIQILVLAVLFRTVALFVRTPVTRY